MSANPFDPFGASITVPRTRRTVSVDLAAARCAALSHSTRAMGGPLLRDALLAAYFVLLHRYTSEEELVVAVRLSRGDERDSSILGSALNLPVHLPRTMRFREVIEQVLSMLDVARAYGARGPGSASASDASPRFFWGWGCTEDDVPVGVHTALLLDEDHGAATGRLLYDPQVLDDAQAEALVRHYCNLVDSVAADAKGAVGSFALLRADERCELASLGVRVRPCPNVPIHTLLETLACERPDDVAVTGDGPDVTYADLDRRSNRLACRLRALGVRTEMMVGVYVDRGVDLYVAMYGIWKAGGVYFPLDPSYPREHVLLLLSDAKPRLMLTHKRLRAAVEAHVDTLVCLDAADERLEGDVQALQVEVDGDGLAYLLYTSGSEGRPKGVLGLHRNLVNRFIWPEWRSNGARNLTLAHVTSVAFTAHFAEVLGAHASGASVVPVSAEVARDARALVELMARYAVPGISTSGGMLRVILDTESDLAQRLPHLRRWTVTGEAAPSDLRERLVRAMPLVNLGDSYGSTEAPPALVNMRNYILDDDRGLVPRGMPGEIYRGGDSVTRGYLNDPELTAKRFLPDPFSEQPGARMYRTGDRGRLRADGSLEVLGRLDDQVKIRGYRVELGYVEANLRRIEGVQDAAVVARPGSFGEKQLVAFVTLEPEARSSREDLLRSLRASVPEYCVPTQLAILPQIPLLPNGKLDRRALLAIDVPNLAPRQTMTAPRTQLQATLAQAMEQLLGHPLGLDDNFMEAGATSLILVRFQRKLEGALGRSVALIQVFGNPTIRALASFLSGRGPADSSSVNRGQARGALRQTRLRR